MSEHTPTPWRVFDQPQTLAIMATEKKNYNEVVHWSGFDASHFPEQARANAYLIVNAVNSHEAMVKALEITRQMIRGQMIEAAVIDIETMQPLGDYIDAALSQAAGGVGGAKP